MIANLVLALAPPQGRADGTDEHRHSDRALQHHDIPQKIHGLSKRGGVGSGPREDQNG